jgi:hypothetical protein
MAQTTTYCVQRALSSAELDSIAAAINAASNGPGIVDAAVTTMFTILLGTLGERLEDYGPDRRLVPGSFAIPATQWTAIAESAMARAARFGGRMSIAMELVDVMPASYDDPSAPVPDGPPADQRPYEHVLTVSREAADVIAAASRRCAELASYFGASSREYREATGSWQRQLSQVFSMDFGSQTRISRDGNLSLVVHTASGLVYGIFFHRTPRRCARDGCQVLIDDDGTARAAWTDAPTCPDGQHAPSYPLDAPHPGTWSFHS